jgi:hypothetical protein
MCVEGITITTAKKEIGVLLHFDMRSCNVLIYNCVVTRFSISAAMFLYRAGNE